MAVHLDRPPHAARLVAWGRAPFGWWACVIWQQRVSVHGSTAEMPFAAWVPATAVRRPSWSAPADVPRVQLAADQRAWPAPPGWPHWYAGPWPNGPVTAPPGVELVHGPAWQQRRGR